MLIRKKVRSSVPPSEITIQSVYLNRRQFMKAAGVVAMGSFLAACGVTSSGEVVNTPTIPTNLSTSGTSDELGAALTSYEAITNYNNFYEFTTDKEYVAKLAEKFITTGWQMEVGGLVQKPKTFDMDELLQFEQEERIYRLRCVEGWSMVIPWVGFPLRKLLEKVEPMSSARYVRFVTVTKPAEMPGLKSSFYPWPYTEGLRLDEALHDLTILATGLYGTSMPNQNGAPVRLVVPWKYGFKSVKSIVKIELTEDQPDTFWNLIAPNEYGFYSNVNPAVSHPRWSQESERRIGESKRIETLLFNGYAEEVANLYDGMDLKVFY